LWHHTFPLGSDVFDATVTAINKNDFATNFANFAKTTKIITKSTKDTKSTKKSIKVPGVQCLAVPLAA